MQIRNKVNGSVIAYIRGGENLSLDALLKLANLETRTNQETGETIYIDRFNCENYYDDMEIVDDSYSVYMVNTVEEQNGETVIGDYIGCIKWSDDLGGNGELAWAIAEKFADELGAMKDATWADDTTLVDENGKARAIVYEEELW